MFYYFIYYKLYKISSYTENQWGKALQMPKSVALGIYLILMTQNIATILIGLHKLFKFELVFTKESALITTVILFVPNYFLLYHKKKYLEIEKRFDRESSVSRNIKSIFFWLYVICSFGALFLLM